MAKVIIRGLKLSKAKIDNIIRFVTPKNLELPPIVIQPASGNQIIDGTYYDPNNNIYLKVARNVEFPYWVNPSKEELAVGYLGGFCLRNREEALVYLTAHEIKHHYQAINGLKFSERLADRYAIKALQKWRKAKRNDLV